MIVTPKNRISLKVEDLLVHFLILMIKKPKHIVIHVNKWVYYLHTVESISYNSHRLDHRISINQVIN